MLCKLLRESRSGKLQTFVCFLYGLKLFEHCKNSCSTAQNITADKGTAVFNVDFTENNNTYVLGNTAPISSDSVEHDINTRNKSGIFKHPCIFLFII